MRTPAGTKKGYVTKADKKILSGLSEHVAEKHKCSGIYVRCIINGTRNRKSSLARTIVEELEGLLKLLRPES